MSKKGDKVGLFVTVVEPLGKLCQIWAQTKSDECLNIETLMTAAESALVSRPTLSIEEVSVGDVFLAKFHEDMKWYRAKVKEIIKAKNTLKVFFIDYGNEAEIGISDIAKGEATHFEIPPQASQFILGEIQAKNNHEWTDIEIVGLNEQLVYGEFEAVVLNWSTVGNPPTIQIFSDGFNSETLATSIISAGFGSRASVGMEEPLGQTVLTPIKSYHVYVVFYESPLNFWIQLTDGEDVLNQLQDTITSEITDDSPRVPHVTIGTVCIAKFCDVESDFETYYRAVVTGIHQDGTCTVLYVDYGNTGKVSLSKLKAMPAMFKELPSQAIQCCLQGSLADADQFKKMLESEHIFAKVISVLNSGLHVVKLSEGEPNLQSQQKVVPADVTKQNTFQKSEVIHKRYMPLQFNVSKQVDICISYVEPSGKFFCQLLENGSSLNRLMCNLSKRYQTNGMPLNIISIGAQCLTRSVDDNCIYRSKILAVNQNVVSVQHIDFGISEDVLAENLLVIDEDMLELPCQSVYCYLENSDNYKTTEVVNLLRRYESETALVGSILLKSGEVYKMELVDTSSNVDVNLIQMLKSSTPVESRRDEHTYRKTPLKVGQWLEVQVTYLLDPANVFCQFVTSHVDLDAVMGQIEQHALSGNTKRLSNFEPNLPCLAKYSEDGVWYRAMIIGKDQTGQFEVYFVDYGNRDVVSEESLMVVPEELMTLPRQCFRGVLDGLVGVPGSWREEDIATLFEMAAEDNHPVLIMKHETHDDLYIVQLFTGTGDCINEGFGNNIGKLSPTFRNKGPPQKSHGEQAKVEKKVEATPVIDSAKGWAQWGQPIQAVTVQDIKPLEVQPGYKNIIVETIVTPGEFYCRLSEHDSDLLDFMDQLNAEYAKFTDGELALSQIAQGLVCCAKFNKEWYRAKILAVLNQEVDVQYVDFGHTEVVPITDLKQLKPEYTKLQAQALKCSLAGVAPIGSSWSDESGQIFEKIMGDSQMVGAFTECGNDGIYLIEVVQSIPGGQISVHEELVKDGIAISLAPRKPELDHVLLQSNRRRQASNTSSSSSSCHGATTDLKYSKPQITVSQTVDVNVVHVETPTEFWVQMTQNCLELENLMNSLQTFYSALRPDQCRIQSVKQDAACIARFSEDDMWYRAEVVQENRGELVVRYVDYGNYEKRTMVDIWEIQEIFMHLPSQAMQCSLHDIAVPPTGWSSTTKDTLEDLVLDKNLLANVVAVSSCPQVLSVKLLESSEDGQINISDLLIHMKLAICSTPVVTTLQQINTSTERATEFPERKPSQAIKEYQTPVTKELVTNDIIVGENLVVNIVWANSPTSFWCQRVESQLAIQQLIEDLSSHYDTLRMKEAELINPQSGQLCVALYNADGNWYRSRVLRTRNREAEVLYVDFGNKDRLPWSKLKEIKSQFLDIPQMAIHCSLNSMEEFDGEYDKNVEQYFSEIMRQKLSLVVKSLPKMSGDPHTVTIADKEGNDVAKRLLQIGGLTKAITIPKAQPKSPVTIAEPRAQSTQPAKEISRRSADLPPVAYTMLKPPINMGKDIELTVSHIESIDSFYCQLSSNTEALDSFMITIEDHYAKGSVCPLATREVKIGMACVAQFSEDKFWYRATVKSIVSTSEVNIIFVDYGNSEVGNIKEIFPLSPKFVEYPVQAFECVLSGMALISSNDALTKFREMVENKELIGKLMKSGQRPLEVELTDKTTGTNINLEMASKFGGSQPDVSLKCNISQPQLECFSAPELPKGNEEVYISHVESPSSFWIQCASKEDEIQVLADRMLERYDAPGSEKLLNSTPNASCTAKFSEDEAWYRARIEVINEDRATVRFVDYGNTDSVMLADLKTLYKDLIIKPPFAIHCCLHAITEPCTGWTPDQKLVLGEVNTASVVFIKEGSCGRKLEPYTVKLQVDGMDYAETLKERFPELNPDQYSSNQSIKPKLQNEVPKFPKQCVMDSKLIQQTAFVSHFEDPHCIFIQLDSDSEKLQNITDLLQDVYGSMSDSEMPIASVEDGTACVALFSEDNAWYRAVIETSKPEITVRFVDFGNAEKTTCGSLKQLTPVLLEQTALGFKTQLHGVEMPASGWSENLNEKLESLIMDQELKILFMNDASPFIVKITVDNDDISRVLQGHINPKTEDTCQQVVMAETDTIVEPSVSLDNDKLPKSLIVKIGEIVYVAAVDSPSKFYLQRASESESLDDLMDQVSASCESLSPLVNPTVGQLCCAKYSEDGAWYRASITKVDECICVQFCDYGNCDNVESSDIRPLIDSLKEVPAYCVAYQLVGASDNIWTDEQTIEFTEMTSDKEFVVRELIDGTSPPSIHLLEGDVDLSVTMGYKSDLTTDVELDTPTAEKKIENGMPNAFELVSDVNVIPAESKESLARPTEEISSSSELSDFQGIGYTLKANHNKVNEAVITDCASSITSDISEEFLDATCEEIKMEQTSEGSEANQITKLVQDQCNIDESSIDDSQESTESGTIDPSSSVTSGQDGADGSTEIWKLLSEACIGSIIKDSEAIDSTVKQFQGLKLVQNVNEITSSKIDESEEVSVPVPSKDLATEDTNSQSSTPEFEEANEDFFSSEEVLTNATKEQSDALLPSDQVIEKVIATAITNASSAESDGSKDAIDHLATEILLQVGDKFEVEVTHVKSPSRFWCVRKDDMAELAVLRESLYSCESLATPSNVIEGQTYAARTDACEWDRIIVTEVDDEKVSSAENALPHNAIRCKLAGIETESWTQDALDFFDGFRERDNLTAKVVAVEDGLHLVYLYDMLQESGGISVNSQLVSMGFAWVAPDHYDDLDLDLDQTVLSTMNELECSFLEIDEQYSPSLDCLAQESALNVNAEEDEVLYFDTLNFIAGEIIKLASISTEDPQNLVCQLTSSHEQLIALVKYINHNISITERRKDDDIQVNLGQACLAYSVKESSWLRARMLAKEDENIAVHFVDVGYGGTVSPDNIQRIPKTAMELPAQAFACSLEGVNPLEEQWTEDAVNKLTELCANNDISAHVCSIGEDRRLMIRIQLSDGQDVGELLISGGYAVKEQEGEVMKEAIDALEEVANKPDEDVGDDVAEVDQAQAVKSSTKNAKSKKKKKKHNKQ